MKFAKLLDEAEAHVQEPLAVAATLSFDAKEGLAQAWADDGHACRLSGHIASTQ